MLTYNDGEPQRIPGLMSATKGGLITRNYVPPTEYSEFQVDSLDGPWGQIGPIDAPAILIVTEGKASAESSSENGPKLFLEPGSVLFIAANTPLSFTVTGGTDRLVAYRAWPNLPST